MQKPINRYPVNINTTSKQANELPSEQATGDVFGAKAAAPRKPALLKKTSAPEAKATEPPRKTLDAKGALTIEHSHRAAGSLKPPEASPGLKGVDSKQQLFGGPPRLGSAAVPDAVSGGHEIKTESQVLMEKRKEHDARQAVKHKKDFITYVMQVLTERPNAQKEGSSSASTSAPSTDIRSILPVDQQEERDPTAEEIGAHVQGSLWQPKKAQRLGMS